MARSYNFAIFLFSAKGSMAKVSFSEDIKGFREVMNIATGGGCSRKYRKINIVEHGLRV